MAPARHHAEGHEVTTVPVAGVCGNCGRAVRPSQPYTYVESVVWEQLGPNGRPLKVHTRNPTGRVRCTSCEPGVVGEQEKLI